MAAFCYPFTQIVPTRPKGQRKYFNKRALRIFRPPAKPVATRKPCRAGKLPKSNLCKPGGHAEFVRFARCFELTAFHFEKTSVSVVRNLRHLVG